MPCSGGEKLLPSQESPVWVWLAGFLPDNCQRDEVHQKGHNGHVRSPVGVIRPQGPALHLTVGEFPLPKYDQGGNGEQEGESPGNHDEDFGLLFCSKERKGCLGIWKHPRNSVENDRCVEGLLEPQLPLV